MQRRHLLTAVVVAVFAVSELARVAQWVVLGTACTGTGATAYACTHAVCAYGDKVAALDGLLLGPLAFYGLWRLRDRRTTGALVVAALLIGYLVAFRFLGYAALAQLTVTPGPGCIS